ncbi:LysR family transcriptional regulator [Methylobacterium nonmethylotrophicum]|uniref:LysR family transcriptional regulator n=1 Tax=Methylobacterium nonmethylotrophicum TaxID=1141884 RepID=A0A4Z0NNL2_9HYPH|nr:LysR family transcriptional regulator [Methylobacterium nonmethylotrophicum]TGD98286.1 LysR family transcriptional regulator [Methylobacterium nonmethylotrophicum]
METRDLAVLAAAAGAGSLSAAARRLGLTPMAASRRLAALERECGARLLHRTTRSVSLTAEGEALLPYAQAMLEAEEAARAALAPGQLCATGLLRATAPAAFGRKVVVPLMPGLLAANPGLRVDLQLSDTVVDIVGEGFDVAVRIAPLRDSGLIARRLAPNPRLLCASPAYLAERGAPAALADLAGHDCVRLTGVTHWPFRAGTASRNVRIDGRFSSSSIEGVHEACRRGLGLALLSYWDVKDELAAGRLASVALGDAEPQDLSIWALYPTARYAPPKLRVFLSALERGLA